MKILKYLGIFILAIVLLFVGAALLAPDEYAVEREVIVNKPQQEVFDFLVLLKNQDKFSVWTKADPNLKKTFSGEDGKVGFISGWESTMDDVGKGEQEIIKITGIDRIDYELRFMKPFEATDLAYLQLEKISENETKVKWGFSGKMDFPMNLLLLFMNMEEQMAPSLQEGLNNMKVHVEKIEAVKEEVSEVSAENPGAKE